MATAIDTREEILGLINALQLCISDEIIIFRFHSPDNAITISFGKGEKNDVGLKKFSLLIPGKWLPSSSGQRNYFIENSNRIDLALLTNFLLLTRLQDDQIISLASQDTRFRPFAEALGLISKVTETPITALSDIRDVVFKTIDQKKLSLKKVAELTGLSQVSLSNFKAGNDIRISTLLKIAKALGIKISFN